MNAEQNKQISLIIMDLVKVIQEDNNVFLSVYFSNDGVSINLYPYNESEGE